MEKHGIVFLNFCRNPVPNLLQTASASLKYMIANQLITVTMHVAILFISPYKKIERRHEIFNNLTF